MPEGLEAEIYRRAAESVVGRTIAAVEVDDRQPEALALRARLPGSTVSGVRRIGKLVLLDLDVDRDVDRDAAGAPRRPGAVPVGSALVLGLHFGMTGRLVVDGAAPIAELEYGSGRDEAAWDRLVIRFGRHRRDPERRDDDVLRVNDPRRWARFTLDPDTSRLGPDVLGLTRRRLATALAGRRAPLKAVLLDQSAVAGFGNLCVDEVLWQAGVSPHRPAAKLDAADIDALAAATRRHLPAMLRRGGSHRGTVSPELRAALPACPRDGAPLRREQVAGRTTVWCPAHQR